MRRAVEAFRQEALEELEQAREARDAAAGSPRASLSKRHDTLHRF